MLRLQEKACSSCLKPNKEATYILKSLRLKKVMIVEF
jgi:hypothetical protein